MNDAVVDGQDEDDHPDEHHRQRMEPAPHVPAHAREPSVFLGQGTAVGFVLGRSAGAGVDPAEVEVAVRGLRERVAADTAADQAATPGAALVTIHRPTSV